AEIPRWIAKRMLAYGDDAESIRAFAAEFVAAMCDRLVAGGAPALHFYTLNLAKPTLHVLRNMRRAQPGARSTGPGARSLHAAPRTMPAMNRHALSAVALAVALHAVPASVPAARAADTIQRCEAADGTVAYTDKSCAVFEQRTVGVSAIVVDRRAGRALSAAPVANGSSHARVGRRSAAAGCART